MHISPFAQLGLAVYVVVGNVQATRVDHTAVYDHHLTVQAVQGMVYVGKTHGVPPHQVKSQGAVSGYKVVRYVGILATTAEGIVEYAHLHSSLGCLCQCVQQMTAYTVVVPLVVLDVDVVLCL